MEAFLTINPITLKKQDSKDGQQKSNKFPSLNAENTTQTTRKQPFSNTVKGIRNTGQVNGEDEGKILGAGSLTKMKKVKLMPLNALNHTKTNSPKTAISGNTSGNTLLFQNCVSANQLSNPSNNLITQISLANNQINNIANNTIYNQNSANSCSNPKDLQSIFIIHNLNAMIAGPHHPTTFTPSTNIASNAPQGGGNLHGSQAVTVIQNQQKMFTRNKKSMHKVSTAQGTLNAQQTNVAAVQTLNVVNQVIGEENLLDTLRSAGGNRKIVSFPSEKVKIATIFTKENNNIENLIKIPALRETMAKTSSKFQQFNSNPIERVAAKSMKGLKKTERANGLGAFITNEKRKEINVNTNFNFFPSQSNGLGSPTLSSLPSNSSLNKAYVPNTGTFPVSLTLQSSAQNTTFTNNNNNNNNNNINQVVQQQAGKSIEPGNHVNDDEHEKSFMSRNKGNIQDLGSSAKNLIQLLNMLNDSDSHAASLNIGEQTQRKNSDHMKDIHQEESIVFFDENRNYISQMRPSTDIVKFRKKSIPGIGATSKGEIRGAKDVADTDERVAYNRKKNSRNKSEFDLKVTMKTSQREDKQNPVDVSGNSLPSNTLLLSFKRAQSNGSGSASMEKTSSSVVERRRVNLLLSNGEKSCILKSLSCSTFSDDGLMTKNRSGVQQGSLLGKHSFETRGRRSSSSSIFPAIQTISHVEEMKALNKDYHQDYSCISLEENTEAVFGNKIRWKILEHLGNGSSCQVYKVKDIYTKKIFVVKKMPIDCCDGYDHEFIRNFKEEFNIVHNLNHKNIIKYLGYEIIYEYLYVYLEYMDKGSLANVLTTEGPLPEITVQTYAKQILNGLEYLHNHKIIHKDIKCSNILIASDGTVKITDFGCAFLIEKTLSTYNFEDKLKRALHGSIPWMAPEVIVQTQFGRNSDIWSFGCTILEMLTSRAPWYQYKFDNPIAAIMKIGLGDDLPLIPDGLSTELREILETCLRRNPESRINTQQLKAKSYFSN